MQRSKHLGSLVVGAGAFSLVACSGSMVENDVGRAPSALTAVATLDRISTLADQGIAAYQNALSPGSISNDRGIRMGSFGSDLFRRHGDQGNTFWMNTDRGPNGQPGGRRTFAVPEFAPNIVRVKVQGPALEILESLLIRGQDEVPVGGLPNLATDEVAWNFNATATIGVNVNGIDPEALVRTSGGDFWMVEEYRPSLLRVDATGHVVKRIVPLNAGLGGTSYPVVESLPTLFNKRRANRGFEGLSLSPDEATMVVGLQSPLEHPTRAIGRASRNLRFLRVDTASEQVTGEFVYQMDEVCSFLGQAPGCGVAPGDMKVSGLAAVTADKVLVLERTDDVAKVYLVDLAAATNIYGTSWDLPATSPAIEALANPATAGVTMLPKTLVVDLSTIPGMPRKIEGVTVVNRETLAISSDNDFGLVDETVFDSNGNLANDTGVKTHILFIKLGAELPH